MLEIHARGIVFNPRHRFEDVLQPLASRSRRQPTASRSNCSCKSGLSVPCIERSAFTPRISLKRFSIATASNREIRFVLSSCALRSTVSG